MINHKLQITNYKFQFTHLTVLKTRLARSYAQSLWMGGVDRKFQSANYNFYKIDGLENKIKRILSLTTFAGSTYSGALFFAQITNCKLQFMILTNLKTRFIGLLFRSL